MRYKIKLLWCFGLLLAGAFVGERAQVLAILKDRLQLRTVPSAVLSPTSLGESLRQLGLLQVVPNDYAVYKSTPSDTLNQRQYLFQRKSQVGIQLYGVDRIAPEALPSSTIVHATEIMRPEPLVSVVIDQTDLYDPAKGILANPRKHGKAWERPAFLSYFEHGELQFASGIGLRLHGGKSRIARMEKSFRAYFRDIYGEDQFPPGLIFDQSAYPLRSLVLHNDRRNNWFLVNPLAYDIATRLGAIAPQTQPVRFFLNGIFQGVYVLTEYLGEDYLMSHYGHNRFTFARSKKERGANIFKMGDPTLYEEFIEWALKKTPMTMQTVGERVNIENLVNWVISILFCGPTDATQGPVLLDMTAPHPTWFWINWDMDHSFQDKYKKVEHPWEINAFRQLRIRDPRGRLFNRMMAGDDEFRHYFFRKFTDAMNHSLTQEFLDERLAYYEKIASEYGISERAYIETIRQFFRHRKAVLREQMQKLFSVGPSYLCSVQSSRRHATLEIDGHAENSGYEGWYFEGMSIKVKVIPAPGYAFSHWLLNGQKISGGGNVLDVSITADTRIEAVVIR